MAGGAELAELAHELEQLGGHSDVVKEVQAEVADVDLERQGIRRH
jgi:simple sugar transport system ATP-binding protein